MAGTKYSKGPYQKGQTLRRQIDQAREKLLIAQNNDCIGGHAAISMAMYQLNDLLRQQDGK